MKVFIINLKKDIERRKHIETLCAQYQLNYEFVDAVNGFELDAKVVQEITSVQESIKLIGRELSVGEIGCTLSHLKIYKHILSKKIDYALVLEDDAAFDQKLSLFLKSFQGLEKEWDILLLGYYSCSNHAFFDLKREYVLSINNKYEMAELKEMACGTHGYLISNKGASKLLEKNKKITLPIDSITGDVNQIDSYILVPPLVHVSDKFDKDTQLELDRKRLRMMYENSLLLDLLISKIEQYPKDYKIVVYGYGTMGKLIFEHYKDSKRVCAIIDKNGTDALARQDISSLPLNENMIIVNTIKTKSDALEVDAMIKSKSLEVKIVSIYDQEN